MGGFVNVTSVGGDKVRSFDSRINNMKNAYHNCNWLIMCSVERLYSLKKINTVLNLSKLFQVKIFLYLRNSHFSCRHI
jgi:hypothetical protein